MGDMKRSTRGVDFRESDVAEDPFADLADMFESELGRTALRSPAATAPAALTSAVPAGWHASHERAVVRDAHSGSGGAPASSVRRVAQAPSLDDDFEAAFADAFDADMAPLIPTYGARKPASRPVAAPSAADHSYQSWIAPRGARASLPVDPALRTASQGRMPAGPETDLETAIRGLSAPANPRDVIIVETQSFAPERVPEDDWHEPSALELDDFDELIASELAAMSTPARYDSASLSAAAVGVPSLAPADGRSFSAAAHSHGDLRDDGAVQDAAHDDDAESERQSRRRPFLARRAAALSASALSLVVVGTVGFFAWNGAGADGGPAGSDEPLLIKADAEPYKVVPKDPGGRSIPNQNKAVYDRVASPEGLPSPTQSALLTDAEEPMDLPVEAEPQSYEDLPGVDLADNEGLGFKDEARIGQEAESVADSASISVLQPRRVRTMIVRPDGTIVQSEAPVTASAPLQVAAAASASEETMGNGDRAPIEGSLPPRAAAGEGVPYSAALVEETLPAPVVAPPQAETAIPGVPAQVADPVEMPAIAPPARAPEPPAAANRPAAPAEAASAATLPLPSGGYFVQISSQPSEALAKTSLQSLGNRFSSLIGGRSVGIQPADIPGKGTFYRVRIAAASKDEAATLCEDLKSAGGNCFVAR